MRLPLLLSIALLLSACASQPKPDISQSSPQIGVQRFDVQRTETDWYQVYAWYPTCNTLDTQPLPYSEDWLNDVLAQQYGIPAFLMGGESPSDSWLNAPPAPGAYPVLIFNHGWGAFARSNMTQMQTLAEAGFVVLSLNHPGDSAIVQDASGQLHRQSDDVLNTPEPTEEDLAAIARQLTSIRDSQTPAAFRDAVAALEARPDYQPLQDNFQRWVADTEHLLTLLDSSSEQLPASLISHLDTTNIGLLGHSFGGAVSGVVTHRTEQHRPTIVMDVPQFTYGLELIHDTPTIRYLNGTDTRYGKTTVSGEGMNAGWIQNNPNASERTFTGAAHMNFTDLNHVPPLKWAGLLGSVDGKVFWNELNQDILTYYRQHLSTITEPDTLCARQNHTGTAELF
ncbi:carboxylic ester hydrolase [Reinekea blandensis]|uniref:Carboxylic ester hydrolase n=1 Tax=Reinekea blandensis MED297 TaxID=314283 RepID=A4BBA5_9GAMM|nr:carboxylic ester hydrolase [Reinekea blandensis]EAR10718.1 Carboxylic ester hydrolase [Reinekea sp. MED297] [Reinekea blandensis MED297]